MKRCNKKIKVDPQKKATREKVLSIYLANL